MVWRLAVTPSAKRDLKGIPPPELLKIRAGLARLAADPHACNIKKLAATEDEWRLRVGQWRVRFRVLGAIHTLEVLRVLPRGNAYRDL
jgi:mRNA interferase RelE/StbE